MHTSSDGDTVGLMEGEPVGLGLEVTGDRLGELVGSEETAGKLGELVGSEVTGELLGD